MPARPSSPPARRRNRYELNYARLERVLGLPLAELVPEQTFRLEAPGFMNLWIEVLPPSANTRASIVALAHYYPLNGDLCADPAMTLRLFHPGSVEALDLVPSTSAAEHPTTLHGRVEALTFQMGVPPIYQEVYPEPGSVRAGLRGQLNGFLTEWLSNLEAQGHRLPSETDGED